MKLHRIAQRPGLTAVQLLVLLAILLLLLALALPALQRVRQAAARTQSVNNLKQLALGTINVADTYRGMLPPVVGEFQDKTGSLHFFILPFIEQAPLYNMAADAVWDREVWGKPIGIFADPDDASAPPGNVYEGWLATTSYAGNWMLFRDGKSMARYPASITDGTSNTLMFATRYQMCKGTPTGWGYPGVYTWAPMFAHDNQSLFQASPAQADCDPERPQAIGNVMLVGMCDGSTRAVSLRISALTWANVCSPSGGEVIGNDF